MKINVPELSSKTLNRSLIISVVMTAILFVLLGVVNAPLKTAAAPDGIISFEFAGKFSRSQAIMESWNGDPKLYAAFSLGLDFLFLVCYPLFFSLACLKLSLHVREKMHWLYRNGAIIMWLPFISGFLDMVENIALIRLIFGCGQEWLSPLAFCCASIKFLLLGIVGSYLVIGFGLKLIKK